MRIILTTLALSLALTACSSPRTTPEQREARAKNIAITQEASKNTQQVQVDGLTFDVFRVDGMAGGPWAKVTLASPASAPHTPLQVEAAAKQATGCNAEFAAGVLAFIGGYSKSVDLTPLEAKKKPQDKGWRADLKC